MDNGYISLRTEQPTESSCAVSDNSGSVTCRRPRLRMACLRTGPRGVELPTVSPAKPQGHADVCDRSEHQQFEGVRASVWSPTAIYFRQWFSVQWLPPPPDMVFTVTIKCIALPRDALTDYIEILFLLYHRAFPLFRKCHNRIWIKIPVRAIDTRCLLLRGH